MEERLRYRSTGFGDESARLQEEAEISRLHVDDNFLHLSQVVQLFTYSRTRICSRYCTRSQDQFHASFGRESRRILAMILLHWLGNWDLL
jgi:hypothetical protein